MKTKTVGTLLIAGVVVLSAMVVFATPAMAWTEDDLENAIEMTVAEPTDVYEQPPAGMSADVDPIWYGYITNENGDALSGLTVNLYKRAYIPFIGWRWVRVGSATTSGTGYYYIYNPFICPPGLYVMKISAGSSVEYYSRYLNWGDYTRWTPYCWVWWNYEWNQTSEIPEFATIALPAASILGLLFFFNHRKRRKEE